MVLNPTYILIIAIAVIGMIVQARLQSVFKKYSRVPFPGGLTGRDVAEKMLRDNGIHDVQVLSTPGNLTDHFDPRNKTVNLSEGVYNSNSVSAAAVAAHECGHAVQHATSYGPLTLRAALVPVINVCSRWSMWVILAGIALMEMGNQTFLFWVGIAMVGAAAFFSLVTLPVEYNASTRAMEWLSRGSGMNEVQLAQARQALNWAACTYLVAAIGSIATLIYYLSFARRN